ncbi:Lrp/AsnC family transcriptional regulator [Nakamurella endophytica]|uniref:AsnC family transcriptional regulator n=1 Tax=Nakamurella endophytica TaxID=1748367 RepID=A0A917SWE5_9ACTN|nr:winged helix-turn-helix transcriptional regulator [Nakamurella endophytica]GGL99705.1 AsnC family transcriptional regulator [Nakamurella endophytica]
MLTRDELRLVDALQLAPRAPWAAVGGVLGTAPVTASRRWAELVEDGTAWVTAAPGMARHNAQCVAYVEITCRPEHVLGVATAIATHPLAVTVELTTGSADILVTVAAVDLRTMSHYLLQHLSCVENVQSSRARIATRIYSEGSAWRLRVLEDPAVRRLEQIRRQQMSEDVAIPPEQPSEQVKSMLTHLALNGRASFVELAERSGTSVTTARRHMSRLLHAGVILLRTDVNAFAVNWPVQVYLWADAPVERLDETARIISRFPQARLTATVAARPSLALCAWLRTVEEVHRLEMAIAAKATDFEVMDRLIVLRQVKRMGRLLDEQGRAVGVVPINIWDDLLPHAEAG